MIEKLKVKVDNRGVPPDGFLWRLIIWGFDAPDEIFEINKNFDIYSSVFTELGPYDNDPMCRRCVMLECLRVLAGFESSWGKNIGVDTSNPLSVKNAERAEAGIWQVSADSMNLTPGLKDLIRKKGYGMSPEQFQSAMKNDWFLSCEYAARVLRVTTKHHGPVRDKFINPWLRRDCVEEFRTILQKM